MDIREQFSKKRPVRMETAWLDSLKVGDKVVRMLGDGSTFMVMRIVGEQDSLWVCDNADDPLAEKVPGAELWTFDKRTGIEVDAFLGWGVESGVTGTFLQPWKEN